MSKSEDKWKTRSSMYKNSWKHDSASSPENRLQDILHFYVEDGRFDANGVRDARVISVDTKTNAVVYEITIQPYLCSKMKTLHGGAACTLLDMLTTGCLMMQARPGFLELGTVSRTMTMTYLRPVQEGQTVRVACRPISVGKKYANVYGEIQSLDGKVCVTCTHDKAVFEAPKL